MKSALSEAADYTKFIAVFLGFISFVLLVYILMALKEILVPITIAIFLTLLFHPVVEYLRKYKVPKWFSIILILIFISGIYYLLILLLLPEINLLPARISEYAEKILPVVQNLLRPFDITIKDLSEIVRIDLQKLRREESVIENIVKTGIKNESVFSIPGLLNDLFFTLLFWVFMIAGKKKFEIRLQKAFTGNRQGVIKTINTIDSQMQYFILLETVIGLSFGVVLAIVLNITGIEFAIIFGFLAFILNFIPKIGVIIASALPVLFSLILYGFEGRLLLLIAILFVLVFIIAKYIEPYFLGKYINLSPVFVLFSLIFWGWIWGIAGLYLAFPIAAIIRIFFSNIESLRPLAIILGSRVNLNKDILLSDNKIQKTAN
ncbi:MAG: AI-2E family transporter [Ignavibacteriaceae bacterium]